MQQGMQLGEAEVLKKLLNRRFGDVPSQYEKMIDSATKAQLDKMVDTILDARTIVDVFAGIPIAH